MEPGQLWREDRIRWLLDTDDSDALFIAGCESNQGRFYDRFDHIVLLRAPIDVMLDRIAARTTNPYGKSSDERAPDLASPSAGQQSIPLPHLSKDAIDSPRL